MGTPTVIKPFNIKLSFPPVYKFLIERFRKVNCDSRTKHPITLGYEFEDICLENRLVELHIQASYVDGDVKYLKFTGITCLGKQEDNALTAISPGLLYHLRVQHPVINGVGLLEERAGENYLVLIQISLSKYLNHDSKANYINNPIFWQKDTTVTLKNCK